MAKCLNYESEIQQGLAIESWHVSQSVDAFTGAEDYDITISGSLTLTGSAYLTPSKILPTGQEYVLAYNNTTGQIFKTTTSSLMSLQQPLTSNQQVGGISSGENFTSGTNLEDMMRQILISNIPSTFDLPTIKNNDSTISGVREAGDSFTINTISFTSTPSNPDNLFPSNPFFRISNGDEGDINESFPNGTTISGNNSISLDPINININTPPASGKSIEIVVGGDNGDIISPKKTIPFRWKNYLCASSIDLKNESNRESKVVTILSDGLIQSTLDTNKEWTPQGNSTTAYGDDKYTYIMYPADYGDLSSIINDESGFQELSTFTPLTNINITNNYGSKLLYKIYQSNSPGVLSDGEKLYIK